MLSRPCFAKLPSVQHALHVYGCECNPRPVEQLTLQVSNALGQVLVTSLDCVATQVLLPCVCITRAVESPLRCKEGKEQTESICGPTVMALHTRGRSPPQCSLLVTTRADAGLLSR